MNSEKEVIPEFLNIQDLSQFLGIKVSTLYAMVEGKRVPHYRIGRLIRFKRSDIEQWIERQKEDCVDVRREAKRVLRHLQAPSRDIDTIIKKAIDRTKRERYTVPHGRPDQDKAEKEVSHGTL